MSYTFTRTMPQLVSLVLRKLGALSLGETPSAEDTEVVREAFDLRLKELHALGVLWFNVAGATTDLALVADVASTSLAAVTDFLYPVSVKLRVSGDDQDVTIISHRQYQAIPNKTDTGEPKKVFFSPEGNAIFWPTPDIAYTAKLTYEATATDTTGTGGIDIPTSMLRSLSLIVAGDLLDDFEVDGQKAARITKEAGEAMRTIVNLNTERVDNATVEMTSL